MTSQYTQFQPTQIREDDSDNDDADEQQRSDDEGSIFDLCNSPPSHEADQDMEETCVMGECDICRQKFDSQKNPPPRMCPECEEKSRGENIHVKKEQKERKERQEAHTPNKKQRVHSPPPSSEDEGPTFSFLQSRGSASKTSKMSESSDLSSPASGDRPSPAAGALSLSASMVGPDDAFSMQNILSRVRERLNK